MKNPNAVQTEFAVERLEKALFLRLVRGDFRAGDLLPAKERLAQTYGVSMNTAISAVGRLVSRGLLIRLDGVGIMVAELLDTCDIDVLIRLMGSSNDERALELEIQLLDLLSINCQEVVFRAAACRTDEQLMWFSHYLRLLQDRIELGAHIDFVADAQYQMLRVLAAASGSVVFTILLNSFRHYLRGVGGIELFPPEVWRQLEDALKNKDVTRSRQIFQKAFDCRIQRVMERLAKAGGSENEGGAQAEASEPKRGRQANEPTVPSVVVAVTPSTTDDAASIDLVEPGDPIEGH